MREQSSRFSVTMKCSFHNLSILLIILCVPGQIFSYDLNTVISKGLNAYRNYAGNINRQFHGHKPDHIHHQDLATSHSHNHYSRYDKVQNSPFSSVIPSVKNAWNAYTKYSQRWTNPISSIFNQISERQALPAITPLGLFYGAVLGVITIGAGYYQAIQEEDERRRQASASTGYEVCCSVTRNFAAVAADTVNDPDQTVTCSFFDLTNGGESLAVVPLGTTLGVSPTTYAAGTELLVVATRTSAIEPSFETVREKVTLGSGKLVVPLNIVIAVAGNNVNQGNALDNNNQGIPENNDPLALGR